VIDIHEADKVDETGLEGSHPRCSGANLKGKSKPVG
jgi:hypothetical protein